MRNIFIIHGSYGNPRENWFPWLRDELEKTYNNLIIPQFPVPKLRDQMPDYSGHDLAAWLLALEKYKPYIDGKTIFIAHSRGCIFLYHFLAQLPVPVSATFLVAPWIIFRWYQKGSHTIDSFHRKPFDWEGIRRGCKYFEIYQSTNDDTPIAEGKKLALRLHAKLIIEKNAGHFNMQSGYKTFPLLLKNIQKVL